MAIYENRNFDYCHRQWSCFTALTQEERKIWESLVRKNKKKVIKTNNKKPVIEYTYVEFPIKKEKIKVRCITTGQTFKTITQAAEHFGVSHATISSGFMRHDGKCKLRSGYELERV